MTAIHWAGSINGNFTNAADWAGGGVPGAGDDAVLDATGSPFTVTSSVGATVKGIQLASNATLAITGATFTATNGTDGGVNAGTIAVTHGAVFQTGGLLDNAGGITLSGASSDLRLLSNTTLTGGGTLSADYGTSGRYTQILGVGPVTLTNVDNTIVGAGQIGDSSGFSLINEAGGVIEADVFQHRLILGSSNYPGDQIVNDGLMLAAAGTTSPSSFLEINHATISGVGGTIAVGANSNVAALYSRISGQTFSIAAGGVLQFSDSQVQVGGVLNNSGQLDSSNSMLTLSSGLTLQGGGFFELVGGDLTGTKISTSLINVNNSIFILGGDLGEGKLKLANQALGTIDCEGTIDTGSLTIMNAGMIEAAQALKNGKQKPGIIMSAVSNTGTLFTGPGGTLVFDGAVTGSGQAVISSSRFGGGRLDFTSSFNENVTFSPVSGVVGVGVLQLAQSQGYTATITGFSGSGKTSLDLGDIAFVSASEATFSGTATSGVLTVTDGTHTANIHLNGNFQSSTFVTSSDGHGGVTVVAEHTVARATQAQQFISALAGLGGPAGQSLHLSEAGPWRDALLTAPRAALV